MELLWGIFLIVSIFSPTEAGRPRPPIPSARVIDKRVGPFFTNEQRRIYNHPYMDDHFRGQPARVREQQRYPQEVPSSQISNRKLLMPIISEGYASTKIQGGTRGKTKVEENPVQMKANVIEQAQVEEISSTKPSTTTTPIPTSATKDVVTNNKVEEPLSSPYFPDIPDLIAQGAAEDTSKNYDVSANSAPVDTGDNPFIIREEEYAYPPPPPVPAPKPPTPVIRPVISENRPLASDRIDIGTGSAEPVSLFDGEDSLSAPPNFAQTTQTIQTNTNDYVRIVASPPKKFNVVPNERLPLSNVDEHGFFKPPKAEYSDKYLAGYEQIDYPDQGGKFPNVNPELIDPDDYHQDRPSFHASQVYGSPTGDFYPLGKPPQPAKVTPDLLTQGQNAQLKPKIDRPEKKKSEGGSFFDFFKLPSFVRASNKADPEGPIIRPKPKRPKVPLNKPKPVRPQGKIPPRSPPPPQGPPPSAPAGPPGVPGVPDLSHFPHMKNPNRPIGTFPQPHEYGGKLNPIVIRVPDGFPGAGPPPPPGAPAPIAYPPPQTALKKKLGRVDAEPNLVEEEYPEQPPQPPKAMVKLPPSPPLLRRPKPPNAALKMTSQPVNPTMPGVAMPPPMRKQEPFLRKKPVRRPLLNLPGIPQAHQRYPHPNYSEAEPKIDLNQYKEKLKDPDFHQNLTKAHVFHATDLEEDVEEVDREEASVPSLTKALLSYLQDANPFNFRPKNKPTRVQTINRMTPADIERLPQNQEVSDESRLIDLAPIARPTKIEKIDKPEVVYKPTQSTTTTSSITTTSTTTTTSTATTEQETTTTVDPIASHVNFLLQQYFSTQTPHADPEAIPMITYDDENQSIVMEYVSPDGEHGIVDDKFEEPVQKAADPQVTSFFPELPENPEDLILPQGMTSLERVFEPSKSTDEADWFVLDENNVRVDLKDQEELEQDSEEEDVALEERIEEIGIETDVESSTDRFTVGDFEPIISPDYVA